MPTYLAGGKPLIKLQTISG